MALESACLNEIAEIIYLYIYRQIRVYTKNVRFTESLNFFSISKLDMIADQWLDS